jgi:hypothetical protein
MVWVTHGKVRLRMRRLLPLALAVALLTVACSTSVDEAEEAYCDSVQTWFNALTVVRALTPTSTVDESKEAVEAMESAYDDVVAAAEDYSDARISEIESALEDFGRAIEEIPDSATLVEADLARDAAYVSLFGVVRSTLDTQCAA